MLSLVEALDHLQSPYLHEAFSPLTGTPLLRYYAKKHLPGGRYFDQDGEPDWASIQGAIDQILIVSHEELDVVKFDGSIIGHRQKRPRIVGSSIFA